MFFSKKIINKDTFLEVVGDEKELVDTIVELYKEQSDDCLKAMRQSAEKNDSLNFKRAAHDLKNVGRNIVADKLVEMAEELESLSDEGELNSAAQMLEQTEKLLQSAQKELLAIRDSLS